MINADRRNSRNLTDAEGIALLERTGASWEVGHSLYMYKTRSPSRHHFARLTIYLDADDSDKTIYASGYGRTIGRAALRCLISVIRQFKKRGIYE